MIIGLAAMLLAGCEKPAFLKEDREKSVSELAQEYCITTDGNGHYSVASKTCGWKDDRTYSSCSEASDHIDGMAQVGYDMFHSEREYCDFRKIQIGFTNAPMIFTNGHYVCHEK